MSKNKEELPHPLDYVEFVMDQMDLTQADLARGGCGCKSHISEMLSMKRKLNVNFIRTFLKMTHRENMAHILIQDYKLTPNPRNNRARKK